MQSAETINITLPDDLMRLIREKVGSGGYSSASDVINEAMRLWQRSELEHGERVADIRARVDRSLADPRPSHALDEVFDRLERRHAERAKLHDDL